jgi:hypothetical protein
MARIFLGLLAATFIGYGLACLVSPSIVADTTGLLLPTGTATAEVRAMYGGLQIGVGLLALVALLREALRAPVLLCLGVMLFGLASGRLVGLVVDSDAGTYNYAAFLFESLSAAASFALLSRANANAGVRAAT